MPFYAILTFAFSSWRHFWGFYNVDIPHVPLWGLSVCHLFRIKRWNHWINDAAEFEALKYTAPTLHNALFNTCEHPFPPRECRQWSTCRMCPLISLNIDYQLGVAIDSMNSPLYCISWLTVFPVCHQTNTQTVGYLRYSARPSVASEPCNQP